MNSFEERPDADELLASIKHDEEKSKKGKLKIFFGMCAGVGKTFTMLQAAHMDKSKGVDIIIGYIETHGRKETDDLTEEFEIISRRTFEYKGTRLQEMDTDAIISRKPKIVLIDELAHTNAPGSRHLKRYQDVQEILDNGIDVYSTVNVQHLESRSDTVAQITGIIVRETLPDDVFEKADEVELVDITPDELLQRFSEGKIYTPEKSIEAVRNFFRKGNVTAMREMALRIVADRVDKQVRNYMQLKHISGPWKSGLHLMVVIGPSLQSIKLLRWAKNLSYTMGASLLALYVEAPQRLTLAQKKQLVKNVGLAKQLGAEFTTTSDDDIVKAILRVAHRENITHIIVGKPRQRNIFSMLKLGGFIQKLIKYSGNIDVYVLGSDRTNEDEYMKYMSSFTFTSRFSQYLITLLIVVVTSFLCLPLASQSSYQIVSFILLFVVSVLATFMGIGPILMASSLCALIWDYFFIPPRFTFHIGSTEDMLMLAMFFLIALVNGVLTYRVRLQESLTRDREERTNALFQLTKNLSQAKTTGDIVSVAVNSIKKHFTYDSLFILQDGKGNLVTPANLPDGLKMTENDFIIAEWSFRHGRNAGNFTDTLPTSEFTFFPLQGTTIKPGVAAVMFPNKFTGYKELLWDTFLSHISNALERVFMDDIAGKAMVLNESDRLYKTLFNTISHELRIPVATIMGSSDTLIHDQHSSTTRNELYLEIYKASERLNRLIENLLNMSRLETGRITPKLDWCDVHDLINKVVDNLKSELNRFNIEIIIANDMPLVKLDFGLMEQVLHNIVFNASQYAPASSTIRIKTWYDNGHFNMQVTDRGPGIPEESVPHIFDKFYRIRASKAGGTGLGLSIVKGFVEAHKGMVIFENRSNGGSRFTIQIPSELPDMEIINK